LRSTIDQVDPPIYRKLALTSLRPWLAQAYFF